MLPGNAGLANDDIERRGASLREKLQLI